MIKYLLCTIFPSSPLYKLVVVLILYILLWYYYSLFNWVSRQCRIALNDTVIMVLISPIFLIFLADVNDNVPSEFCIFDILDLYFSIQKLMYAWIKYVQVRVEAASTIATMLEGQALVLTQVAEYKESSKRGSFTTLSCSLGQILMQLHTGRRVIHFRIPIL